jgi:hypothetical protein
MQLSHIRLTGIDKLYYLRQFEQFEIAMVKKFNCQYVAYGKQDTRGAHSICLFSDNGCVSQQRHFDSKDQLIGFVVGYNSHTGNHL